MADTTETKEELSRGEFAAYLRELADEFEGDGDVRISVGNKDVTLRPSETITADIEVSERSSMLGSDKESLDIEASWSPEAEGGES